VLRVGETAPEPAAEPAPAAEAPAAAAPEPAAETPAAAEAAPAPVVEAAPADAAPEPAPAEVAAETPAEPAAPAEAAARVYVVQPGDTLWAIAASQLGDGGRWLEVAEANGLAQPYNIDVGQELRIPD
jgi:nucleoid-associated protein YgaU